MEWTGNTILITGGGSGIGRGLAEQFHALGNKVIISGRRKEALEDVATANRGIETLTLDIESPEAIKNFASELTGKFPALNVVIHNAGIMRPERLTEPETADAEAHIATNLLGPIRLNAALIPHLLKQPKAAVLTLTSGLAFAPMAMNPTYCATKAAIHSWTQSLRYQLRNTAVEVIELAPPYVQTHLQGERQANDPNAMPLEDYIAETMRLLQQQPTPQEVLVERVKPQRFAERDGKYDGFFATLNEHTSAAAGF